MTTPEPLMAAVDVGSHSVKLTLARHDPVSGWQIELEQVVVTGLGRKDPSQDGLLPESATPTLEALQGFAELILKHAVRHVAAVGTMVLRQARAADRFVEEVRRSTGLPLQIISGENEARLTYLGATAALPRSATTETVLTLDVGGASTELAWGRSTHPEAVASLPLGTLSLTRAHGLDQAVSSEVVEAAIQQVVAQLEGVPVRPTPQRILATGATPASLAALQTGQPIADSQEAHGRSLTLPGIEAQIEHLRTLPAAARRRLPGLHPDRAEVILAGAVILAAAARLWPATPMTISTWGLRLGLLIDRFLASTGDFA